MTHPLPDRIVVVRVDAEEALIAVVERDGLRALRGIRVPGGAAAIDDRLIALIAAEVPGGLPSSEEPRFVAAWNRLRAALASARGRLQTAESTTVAVRFPGRMTFVTLDRADVATAISSVTEAVVARVREVQDGASVLALDGVAAAPGLLDALPGPRADASEVDADALGVLLDAMPSVVGEAVDTRVVDTRVTEAPWVGGSAADAPEPKESTAEGPEPGAAASPAPARVVPVRVATDSNSLLPAVGSLVRAWPVAAAAATILVLGGAAAAIGLGASASAPVGGATSPASGTAEGDGRTGSAVPTSPPSSPPATGTAPDGGDAQDAPPTVGTTPATRTNSGRGTGTATGTGGSGAAGPAAPAGPAPDPDTTASDPATSDTASASPAPAPSDLGDLLGGLFDSGSGG